MLGPVLWIQSKLLSQPKASGDFPTHIGQVHSKLFSLPEASSPRTPNTLSSLLLYLANSSLSILLKPFLTFSTKVHSQSTWLFPAFCLPCLLFNFILKQCHRASTSYCAPHPPHPHTWKAVGPWWMVWMTASSLYISAQLPVPIPLYEQSWDNTSWASPP